MTCLAAPTGPGLERTLIGFRLDEWGLSGIAGDVVLIAGELVANAVAAAPSKEIRVWVSREPHSVVLRVWDSSECMPIARPVKELGLDDIVPDARALERGRDGGWGLPIVVALSSECGVRRTPPSGKWVWARYTF
ncbi:ATP-binding protein [Actinomadura sp. NEAU-AAG7]|uniref:ATP-binding protein n=1 Tax=Actinomadura sp. NEAU-AAG7 TaxID=2839640 RepID=UPI001BE48120|nr:ATP-binding protein [Actinomadura sp. NEAU-AAG7]MBT2206769.1 ATP-binding protein [Actinomadura sp. NEAU-AAG7]